MPTTDDRTRRSATSFFDSLACRSGDHCRTCRDPDAGRTFRSAVATRFDLPSTDFACPHGRPWHLADTPAAPAAKQAALSAVEPRSAAGAANSAANPSAPALRADPAEVKRRFAICKDCEHSRDNAFDCALHPGCCFGRWRSNPANDCPARRW